MVLFLIDGSSYFYRAFHAIKDLSNSKGLPTNAIYGFTNMLFKLIKDKKPDALAIVLDSPSPTERHRIYEGYKAQRAETPPDLIAQIPHIKRIIQGFNLPSFEMPGFEADDIICTIATKAAAQGADVFIVSGDKDMMQAVDRHVRIYDPMKDLIIDENYVFEKFGLPPARVTEFMALTGDAVDNIPGVKGIGEKTARELLTKTGSLDELMAHPEKIQNVRLRNMITENLETIKLSRTLVTIDMNMPIDVNMPDLVLKEPDWQTLLPIFIEFELKSLARLVPSKGHKPRGEYSLITSRKQLSDFLS